MSSRSKLLSTPNITVTSPKVNNPTSSTASTPSRLQGNQQQQQQQQQQADNSLAVDSINTLNVSIRYWVLKIKFHIKDWFEGFACKCLEKAEIIAKQLREKLILRGSLQVFKDLSWKNRCFRKLIFWFNPIMIALLNYFFPAYFKLTFSPKFVLNTVFSLGFFLISGKWNHWF